MLTLYLIALAAGAVLIVFSLLADAGDHAGEDPELESDVVHLDAGGDGDADADGGAEATARVSAFAAVPILSLRFWTFFLGFGGLAGALLTWLAALGPTAIAACAIAVGVASGIGAAQLVRWARRGQVSSTLGRDQCIGATGTVLLPIARGSLGRVRVQLEDRIVDFDAETDDATLLEVAEPAVIYEVRDDGVVLVTSTRNKSLSNASST